MKQLNLEFFDIFECIGSDCSDNCCRSWSIDIDPDTAEIYRNIKGAFGDRLRESLTENNGKCYIRLNDQGKCPLLNKEGLCEVYRELEPDKMSETCKTYPRISWYHGDILFRGLTISCPEVARMVLSHSDSINFSFGEAETGVIPAPDENWSLFNILIDGMITSVRIMQNRDLSIFTRMRLLVSFNDMLQSALDADNDEECRILLDAFSDPAQLAILSQEVSESKTNLVALFTFVVHFYKNIPSLRVAPNMLGYLTALPDTMGFLNSLLQRMPAEDFLDDVSLDSYALRYEQYAVYYLTRYYMDAYTKDRKLDKIIANFIYLFCLHRIFAFGLYHKRGYQRLSLDDLIPIYTEISRFLEHNDLNSNALYEIFSDADMTDSTFLFSLI